MPNSLIFPDGFRPGCLPRKSRFGTVSKVLADEIDTILREDWDGLIGQVSLRPHVNQILDQNGYSSCATEATAQSVMITRDVAGEPFTLLNPLSIYRVTSGGSDNGSTIDENLVFARDTGILPESYWPRSKGFRATPPTGWKEIAKQYRIGEFYDIGTVDELGTALLLGFSVVFGWQGHSCVFVELLSETEALYANSWGPWGDQGFGKLRLNSINWGYGAFATRTAVVPSEEPDVPVPA